MEFTHHYVRTSKPPTQTPSHSIALSSRLASPSERVAHCTLFLTSYTTIHDSATRSRDKMNAPLFLVSRTEDAKQAISHVASRSGLDGARHFRLLDLPVELVGRVTSFINSEALVLVRLTCKALECADIVSTLRTLQDIQRLPQKVTVTVSLLEQSSVLQRDRALAYTRFALVHMRLP
jgi:hypothetical protein